MISFKIPEIPQNTSVLYSHPYKKPQYQLNEFEIDFNDFPLVNDNEKTLKEKQELDEKKAKIMELDMLKELEEEEAKKFDEAKKQYEESLLSDSKRKKEIKNLNKLIGNLENCIADLTRYFNNYHSEKQNALFDRLNKLMYESDLKLTGEDENTRSELLYDELSSLKPNPSKKSKNKK